MTVAWPGLAVSEGSLYCHINDLSGPQGFILGPLLCAMRVSPTGDIIHAR